jgi:SAM-dependent methyltransferase
MLEQAPGLARLQEHRRIWNSKPDLRRIYAVWFDALLRLAPPGGFVLEVGAGPGLLSDHAHERRPDLSWTATDLIPAPWNDVAADAERLPLRGRSVDAILGLDTLHHLRSPARFFEEAVRVLRPGGRIGMLEPWVTALSFPIYRWLHQEGCDLGIDPWAPFAADPSKDPFQGDGAVPWRIVKDTSVSRWKDLGLSPPRLETMNGFAYLLSLGFRRVSLLPPFLVAPLLDFDRHLAPWAHWLGLRSLIRWEPAFP